MSTTTIAAPMTNAELDQLSVNTIRTLSIDAVERAKSGHPGTPMAGCSRSMAASASGISEAS